MPANVYDIWVNIKRTNNNHVILESLELNIPN